jgi:hypothetical protein
VRHHVRCANTLDKSMKIVVRFPNERVTIHLYGSTWSTHCTQYLSLSFVGLTWFPSLSRAALSTCYHLGFLFLPSRPFLHPSTLVVAVFGGRRVLFLSQLHIVQDVVANEAPPPHMSTHVPLIIPAPRNHPSQTSSKGSRRRRRLIRRNSWTARFARRTSPAYR